MPRLKPSATELHNRQTQAVFDYAVQKERLDYDVIAKNCGCTSRTIQKKKKNPESMTLKEIRIFARLGKLTDAQLVEFIAAK